MLGQKEAKLEQARSEFISKQAAMQAGSGAKEPASEKQAGTNRNYIKTHSPIT